MDRKDGGGWLGVVMACALLISGCGTSSASMDGGVVEAQGNARLSGRFVDGSGGGFEFLPNGRMTVVGHPESFGSYTRSGNQLVLKLPGGQGAIGAVEGPDEIALIITGDPGGKRRFHREGSTPTGERTRLNGLDRSLPLETYTDITGDGSSEGMAFVRVALQDPPATADETATWLMDAGNEPDAFKRNERIQVELPPVAARLDSLKGQRYFKLRLTAERLMYEGGHKDPGRRFPLIDGTLGGRLVGPYDLARKGFPSDCFAAQQLGGAGAARDQPTVTLRFSEEERVPSTCLLPISDEALARSMESARVQHAAPLTVVDATLYFYVVRLSNPHTLSAVLTHATVQYGVVPTPGQAVETVGPLIEVGFPQPGVR